MAQDYDYRSNQVDRPSTRGERLLYWIVSRFLVLFARIYWRLEVHGRENVPDGAFILSGVHRSNIDTPVVAAVTPRRLRYMGKHTMWKYSLPGKFFTAMGGFGVNRGTADREALRTCVKVLETGEPLVMFPEGARRSGPVVEDLFEGPAYVASRAKVPILPVGIGGTEAAMPVGSSWLKPVKVVVVIGEPIPAPTGEDGKRPTRRAVSTTTDVLRERLQVLFDDAQRRAGRPNKHR